MLNVYITDLSAYNSGYLVGEWVSLPINEDDLHDKVREILTNGASLCGEEEHEEYFITDWEFEDGIKLIDVSEYSNLDDLNSKCDELSELDSDDLKKVSYLIENVGYDFEDALQKYDEVYIYENMTLIDVVEQYIDETVDMTNIPEIIANNIDFESISRDWEISGEFERIDNDIYHFVNC